MSERSPRNRASEPKRGPERWAGPTGEQGPQGEQGSPGVGIPQTLALDDESLSVSDGISLAVDRVRIGPTADGGTEFTLDSRVFYNLSE